MVHLKCMCLICILSFLAQGSCSVFLYHSYLFVLYIFAPSCVLSLWDNVCHTALNKLNLISSFPNVFEIINYQRKFLIIIYECVTINCTCWMPSMIWCWLRKSLQNALVLLKVQCCIKIAYFNDRAKYFLWNFKSILFLNSSQITSSICWQMCFDFKSSTIVTLNAY